MFFIYAVLCAVNISFGVNSLLDGSWLAPFPLGAATLMALYSLREALLEVNKDG